MGWLRNRQAMRRRQDDAAVLRAIRMLRPEYASGYPISRLAGVGIGRVYVALARMEADGRVTSDWETPSAFLSEFRPRRRLYRIALTLPMQVEAGR